MKKKKTFLILILVLIVLLIIGGLFLYFHRKGKIIPTKEELKPTEYKRVKLEDGSEIVNYGTCVSTEDDETCYLIVNESMLTLRNSKVTKESGDSTNLKESKYSGLNSAILATYGTIIKIEDSNITTEGEGATGVYVNGQKAKGEFTKLNISTLKINSPGLAISNTGSITGDHVTINTKVKDSPAVLINNGVLTLTDSMLETNGAGSPIIYTDSNVRLINTTGTANGSRIAIMENNANVVINNSTMVVGAGSKEDYSESAVLITATDKDAKSVFQSINSSLNINKNLPYYNNAYFFIVDKANTEIDLKETAFNFGSGNLLKGTNSNIVINLDNDVLYGTIDLENSNLKINLINNSSYTGKINNGEVSIFMSKDSELNLTGDLHLKSFTNDDTKNNNVILNGFHIYVNDEIII